MISTPDPHHGSRRRLLAALCAALVVLAALTLSTGAVAVAPGDALRVVTARLGLGSAPDQADAVVWGLRMPRLLLAAIVGAALAAAGASMQAALRNRLADPHLLAIGPGAAIGAALGSSLGGSAWAVFGGAGAGLLTGVAVERLARHQRPDPTRLILLGVALGLALSAWVGFVVFAADRATVPPIEFWLLGSLTAATWRTLAWTAICVAASLAVVAALAPRVDVLRLGETDARGLGVNVDGTRTTLLAALGVGVGATVGAVGVVAFVGLVVPALVIGRSGARQRHVLPATVLAGAASLVAADWIARTAIAPVELPVGLVTAAVGGPFLLWQLRHRDT